MRHRILVAIAALMTASVLHGGSVGPMPIEVQKRDADLVVVGTYSGTHSVTIDPDTRIPYREQVVTVTSCPKQLADASCSDGTPTCPPSVIVRSIGGTVPAYDKEGNEILRDGKVLMLEVDDSDAMPSLTSGEHVLFLTKQGVPNDHFRLLGSREGMRTVVVQPDGSKTVTFPVYDWNLLSEAGKKSAANLAVSQIRSEQQESHGSAPSPDKALPKGLYYTDTVTLDELVVLFDRIPDRLPRPTPAQR